MEVARRFWRGRIAPVLSALAARMGDALEEWAFRLSLAFDVLAGRLPASPPRRWWNRAQEPPTLIDAFDWTDERLIFSVLVWPSLEDDGDHAARLRQVYAVLHAGATDMNWSTRYGVHEDLRWDAPRGVWVCSDGFAYDGSRLYGYSRAGSA